MIRRLLIVSLSVAVASVAITQAMQADAGSQCRTRRGHPCPTRTATPRPPLTTATPTPTATPRPATSTATATRTPTATTTTSTATRTPTATTTLPPATATATAPRAAPTATPAASATPAPTAVAGPPQLAGSRDKYRWPFAPISIWNMPIGSGAVYVPAGIQPANAWAGEITTDDEYIDLNPSDPMRSLNGGGMVHVPADMSADGGWNGVSAFLTQDGRVAQGQPLVLTPGGNPRWDYTYPTVDLYGDGIDGAHGGSGLSSFGGSIRKGELSSADPLRHALKVNLNAKRFISYGGGNCYRWPARHCDAYASPSAYAGGVPALRMGALLALRADVDISALGLQSAQARKIARALQDYGAYVADDTAWDVHAIDIEKGAEFGDGGSFHQDLQRVFTMLNVVDNNSAMNIGGGGTPRVPLAPAIGN